MDQEEQRRGGALKYFIIILIILAAVFLSQQVYSRIAESAPVSDLANQAAAYLSKGSNWAADSIYSKISGLPAKASEMQSGGEAVQNSINQGAQNVSQNISDNANNISEKISNYFSGIADSILHPGENNDCPAPTGQ